MTRTSWFVIPAVAMSLVAVIASANPPEERDPTSDTLKWQMALGWAKTHLMNKEPAKAVELLEGQLPHINGNREYLIQLRNAYRDYLGQLKVTGQTALVEKYERRLKILEGSAPAVAAVPSAPPTVLEQVASTALVLPAAPLPAITDPKDKLQPPPSPLLPATVRGAMPRVEDPFNPTLEKKLLEPQKQDTKLLLARAETAFNQKNYLEARNLFEQAYQSDPTSTDSVRDRWAYSKLNFVVEQINHPQPQGLVWTNLEHEVKVAVAMAPNLKDTGDWLLAEMQKRRGNGAGLASATVQVNHLPRSPQGWEVAETTCFRIYHRQSKETAEKVAQIAEKTRREMSQKWFGHDGENWTSKCELFLHATGQDYSQQTGVPASSPGHSRIETDPKAQRVVSRRIDLRCDNPTLLSAVLPHETTHVVIAGQYGPQPVPRWADEGVAVLTEPAEKIEQHRRNLHGFHQSRKLFHVQELMQLQDYPSHDRVGAFYAQSVSLVEFLTKQKGPQVFSAFLKDGLRGGYEPALAKHYGFRNFADLHERWNQQVQTEMSATYAGSR